LQVIGEPALVEIQPVKLQRGQTTHQQPLGPGTRGRLNHWKWLALNTENGVIGQAGGGNLWPGVGRAQNNLQQRRMAQRAVEE